MYNRDGSLFAEGIFTLGGLLAGKMYYPNGQVKFIGTCNDKNFPGKGDYYGPTYPVEGQFFLETGELLHEGDFRITRGGEAILRSSTRRDLALSPQIKRRAYIYSPSLI